MSGERIPMRSEAIAAELKELDAKLSPMLSRQRELKRALYEARSRENIQKLGIRRSGVVLSSGPDRPRFGHSGEFIEWIYERKLDTKPWVEWNDGIYRMDEFLLGKVRLGEMLASLDHVRS